MENGNYTEEEAAVLLWEFNLKRTAESLLREAKSEMGRPAKVIRNGHFAMTGFVCEGRFHVFDTIEIGLSYRELVVDSPAYRPITLQSNSGKGDNLHYLD